MKKYVVCGVSHRGLGLFVGSVVQTYNQRHRIVGLLDVDPKRFEECYRRYPETEGIATYGAHEFERMLKETTPDAVMVAGMDSTHAEYIIAALRHDLDVITEKPMAISAEQCRAILAAERASKGEVTVAFNYRYSPYHRKIKELILEGKIGRVTSVDLNWLVDTHHGSSYFKRWNRRRAHSGGLSIHKSTHHFDLVNWWIDQKPVQVFAHGALHYFGPDSELNPRREDGRVCETCAVKPECRYVMRWTSRSKEVAPPDDHLTWQAVPIADRFTAYRPDRCIFDSEIDIEDTYAVNVQYDRGALLSYSIHFSAPYEGYRLAINGTKGRIETQEFHAPARLPFDVPTHTIDYFPMFGSKQAIQVVEQQGGHGGGDPLMLEDMFLGPDPLRDYRVLAGAREGAYSIAIGEAVWRSAQDNRPVSIPQLLQEAY
ncbi:Gfo/Idh/MocA family oxidoreductase [Paenibacillus sp. IB182496]|uniref:Gfo/Idh/MocA family oxidoreductase n=1 Tax=Paenibacillus sabuli TaxID=2772509 RepID=A0A927GQN9_9BACL|nr:Gfo/Idh/MocA family oxidoreductase [Paenibacillus sabuli]MBD2844095.1 Gfo/Idh/MocA family oxidoreductase [Paenibacillus sabuli]